MREKKRPERATAIHAARQWIAARDAYLTNMDARQDAYLRSAWQKAADDLCVLSATYFVGEKHVTLARLHTKVA